MLLRTYVLVVSSSVCWCRFAAFMDIMSRGLFVSVFRVSEVVLRGPFLVFVAQYTRLGGTHRPENVRNTQTARPSITPDPVPARPSNQIKNASLPALKTSLAVIRELSLLPLSPSPLLLIG